MQSRPVPRNTQDQQTYSPQGSERLRYSLGKLCSAAQVLSAGSEWHLFAREVTELVLFDK